MSDSSFKPPESKAGSNPSLTRRSSQDAGAPSAGASHRLPGAFVPPSDSLSRGLPKAGAKNAGKSQSRSGLVLVVGAGFILVGLGVAFFLAGGDSRVVLEPEIQPSQVEGSTPVASPPPVAAAPAQDMTQAPLPDWVPTYPSGSRTSFVSTAVGGGAQGNLQYKTTSSNRAVIEYYRDKLEQKGLVLTALTITPTTGVIEAKSEDGVRKLIVMSEPAPQGATASIVFTTMDPDKSRPVPGGRLPEFAEPFPGAEMLEQTSRLQKGSVFGYIKMKAKTQIRPVLDFYQKRFQTAHYEVERTEREGFGKLEGTSMKDAGGLHLFVEEKNAELTITLKLDAID